RHGQRPIRGGDLRRDASTHRLAADAEETPRALEFCADRGDYIAIARLEHRRAIRNLPPLLDVWKVEGDDVQAEVRQRIGEVDHERAALAGAGAVRQYQ